LAGILFIISAPSGSGKSTLVKHVRALVDGLDFSVSYTTRARRGAEQPGREYHYITPEKFLDMKEHGEFLEWASVFGNYYGTACQSLIDAQAAGKDLLLDIDVQGAAQVRDKMPDAVSIFVLPPNPDVLKMRLRDRSLAEGKLDEAEVERRLGKAKGEIDRFRQYDYVIVNDILAEAVESLTAIVLSERVRRQGTPPDPESVRMMLLADKNRQANAGDRLYKVLDSFRLLDMHATRA
jgi:guanylate kinase